ncbi:MAG: alpha/beta fold hydrolase [Acidobacteria bacterium]|nr:alpha/beta fold hydrolase [Acidobacteriota bacterium]
MESTKALESENYSVVRVFYATDRAAETNDDGKLAYDGGRSPGGALNYGECLISIPKVRKLGELSSPSIWRLEFRPNPNKHIVLLETISKEEADYLKLVREAVEKSPDREAFVFIHGYNVAFVDAARRTGQMAYDLQFKGAPIFYSWPSNDKTKDYPKDEADVAWSAPHLERFLNLLGSQSGAARIHIIAHSMGNRAACEALKGLSRNPIPGLEFRHVILAAPDIDADTFAELSAALKTISHRLTLYASSNDKALWASKTLHGNPRAGQAGDQIVIVTDVDTIDASAISTDFLAHSYFSDSWPLLADIQSLLNDDKPPESRFGLLEVKKPNGRYFAFQAN